MDSPDVMKDFPGLYSEKKKGNDSDYNDDNEKTKKEMLIGKRKDKKDKDRGYEALEGESSDEASPCKVKKTKTFKFTKSKDKSDNTKEKGLKKKPRLGSGTEYTPTRALAELPLFGVPLKDACKRGKCHDGICIPLPVRECIDYIEEHGLMFENIYKISGPKNKVHQIRKLYNNREKVNFAEYDVPTATSFLKSFLRDLPEPIFTNDLLVRFEEAGAILNYNTRTKHFKSLISTLPSENYHMVVWILLHLEHVASCDDINKMNKLSIAHALKDNIRGSARLIINLLTSMTDLFPDKGLVKYYPPLESTDHYPDDPLVIKKELQKLESAVGLIHWEIQQGYSSETRQDQLWDVQRVLTELKRKLKKQTVQSSFGPTVEGDGATTEDTGATTECDVAAAETESSRAEGDSATTQESSHKAERDHSTHDGDSATAEGNSTNAECKEKEGSDDGVDGDKESVCYVPTTAEQNQIVISSDSDDSEEEEHPNAPMELTTPLEFKPGNQNVRKRSREFNLGPGYPLGFNPAYQSGPRCAGLHAHHPNTHAYLPQGPGCSGTHTHQPQGGALQQTGRQPRSTQSEDIRNQFPTLRFTEDHLPNELRNIDRNIRELKRRIDLLLKMADNLARLLDQEKMQIKEYRKKVDAAPADRRGYRTQRLPKHFEEVRELLVRENHMLEIKKVQLVRQIMDNREQCVNMKARMRLAIKDD